MSSAETLAVLLVLAVCGALMAGYPVALTLGGVSIAVAVIGHLTGLMDIGLLAAFGPTPASMAPEYPPGLNVRTAFAEGAAATRRRGLTTPDSAVRKLAATLGASRPPPGATTPRFP